jgi:hypothetical protein
LDILGQLRKLVALTFRTGDGTKTITFKSTENPLKKPADNLAIDIVKSPDDNGMDDTHEMVTNISENVLRHKTIKLADTTNDTENYITGIKDIVPINHLDDSALEINRHYLTDSSVEAFVINLPSVITLDPLDSEKSDKLKERAIIRISDATGSWSENAVTVMPAAGEKINELDIGEGFILDVSNSWVELTWNDTLQEWTVNLSGAVKDFSAWFTLTISASIDASKYNEIITDGTAGITIKLPPPELGARVRVVDGGDVNDWSVNNVIVTANAGEKINFDVADLTLDVGGAWVELISNGTDWFVLTA